MPNFDYTRIIHTCCYAMAYRYCNKPVKYTMVRDDDDNLVRAYSPHCELHSHPVTGSK